MVPSLRGRAGSVLAAIPMVIDRGFVRWVDNGISVCKHISLVEKTHVRYNQVYRDYAILMRRIDPTCVLPHEPSGRFVGIGVERLLFINFISRTPPSANSLAGVLSALRDRAKRFRCSPFLSSPEDAHVRLLLRGLTELSVPEVTQSFALVLVVLLHIIQQSGGISGLFQLQWFARSLCSYCAMLRMAAVCRGRLRVGDVDWLTSRNCADKDH